ncbi:MAG: phosphate transport system regulatory protein PhoU [Spirochaetae bacterium HGW-Spirochaetae-1]|jgi:phosphate transport system protein|nr:MAG: phosphate transport system regulatory protein PhoU [Spirochaetae bacterium HGW-Spirochaetae-1]
MATYLEQELGNIKLKIYEMADQAIEAISDSVDALKNSNLELAQKVIQDDTILDRLEIELDDECIKVLVTRQPAAVDLRFILAMLKINTDLERMGDLATNIAKETIRLDGKPQVKPLMDIPRMAAIGIEMIKGAFQSITDKNVDMAREVIKRDSEIDELNIQVYRELFSYMAENPRIMSQSLGLIMVSKALERIGDHATNIAERAIYYIKGVDIRHAD